MKKSIAIVCAMAFILCMGTTAFAAELSMEAAACYPTAVTRSEDGTEIRKMYDLSPADDPAGIPRSDFEQDGYRYTLVDLLKQELPGEESRVQTETVCIASKSKDMASVLSLLPQEKEFITEDGLCGVLTLKLDSVKVEVSGYGSATKDLSATRTYLNLGSQDTSCIPKEIEENGHTLTLQEVSWQTDSVGLNGIEHFTATASYAGSTTNVYIKGYTVTANYTGTVSRINLSKTRYVAIFEGKAIEPVVTPKPTLEPSEQPTTAPSSFNWGVVLIPIGLVALAGAAVGVGIYLKRRKEDDEEGQA